MIGTTLAGRYEIMARIGGGGMALVYKALDVLLNRHVAVKILRQQFVFDEEFIRRFRREAQSAASLSHPNVVSIYDVGQEEEDIHFIVMEYVEGLNLNEVIQDRAPLQSEEAVRIAIQICDALDHAHQNHIIHRDIKPHNILIGKNGRVKVTDFGIARAVTSSTITQTGSVIGSVHYFSPEHAKGVATGEKSDLYSLGIVLYQMLTGSLPFLGESPISVALKHLQDTFEEPRKLNSHIPQSVENIILKSMRKNPSERYQSATEMLQDLETCLAPSRLQEPRLTFAAASARYDDDQETRVMPAIREVNVQSNERFESEHVEQIMAASTGAGSVQGTGGSQVKQSEGGNKSNKPAQPGKKAWVKPAIWIGITVLFLAIMVGVVFYVKSLISVKEIEVPNLVSKTETEARNMLTELNLDVEEPSLLEYHENVAKGIVFDQSKPAGTKVKEGSKIRLSISEGTAFVELPDLTGHSYESAVQELIRLGFESSRIQRKPMFSDEVQSGEVVKTSPAANTKVDPRKETIQVHVSKGKEMFRMPNLIGKTKDEALAQLQSSELKLKKNGGIIEESSFVPVGEVIRQSPYEPNDQVEKGAEITIYVSSGYPPEALKYTLALPVFPQEEGKESTFRIVYSDARGESKEWGKQKISTSQILHIELVLAPNKDGAVSVYRDGQYLESYPVTYNDAKNNNVPQPNGHPTMNQGDGQSGEGTGNGNEHSDPNNGQGEQQGEQGTQP
ncbi:Stk1 family PASTA domain-containing Ser/Thr kinase [Paenibacillus sp. 481]|uniref:Stk1 family PASTA domain-containing Ser/Thr kinase n=1 Tax=Paenibacillus sp. 481 TaxID=2835869 RepID=UPI001E4DCAFD|nr:Stk1 family PASTA domain-containing Ser/Thr kinase [Paenibacillus sp. 481]UHA74031.1 Stk1 family PASTA domain-containing Ser/Thr kinase [Paenibacillus sp. 481]